MLLFSIVCSSRKMSRISSRMLNKTQKRLLFEMMNIMSVFQRSSLELGSNHIFESFFPFSIILAQLFPRKKPCYCEWQLFNKWQIFIPMGFNHDNWRDTGFRTWSFEMRSTWKENTLHHFIGIRLPNRWLNTKS